MADLDAELLALAGGDSSGEESIASPPRRKSSSPPPSAKRSPQPAIARKGMAESNKKARKRRTYSDDEDEPSSPSERSESASMSRSDSEAEFDPSEDKPIFPYEKLYYDAKDKAEVQSKPEIERETILAQRSEQVDRHEQDLQLRRLLASRAKETAKATAKAEARNKRKASAAELDDGQRKSSRQRTKVGGGRAGEASTAIAAYKRHREERNLRDEQRKSRIADRRALSPTNDYSDADGEAESDNEYDDRRYHRRRSPTPPKDDPVAELSDIQRVRVGRDNFAQVCWTPGFEEAISNCYARVCLGPGRTPGVNEYRLCLIKGFQEGRPYAMTAPNGKTFLIDRYILALHGKAQKAWSFLECSNSKFTDDEWRRYRLTMANEDCRMPTRGQINAKLDQINKLISHRFTDLEISEKLKKQNALMDIVNRTSEKKELKEQIYNAQENGDDDAVAELEEKLANLVPLKLALGTSLSSQHGRQIDQEAEHLAEVNRRNQRITAENVRKAAMEQRRIYKKRAADANRLAPLGPDDDLFGSASDISRTGTPVNGVPYMKGEVASGTSTPVRRSGLDISVIASEPDIPRSTTPTVPMKTGGTTKKGLPAIKKSKRDDEVLADLDLGIDIEI